MYALGFLIEVARMGKNSLILFLVCVALYGCMEKENDTYTSLPDQPDIINQNINDIYNQCSGTAFFPPDSCQIPTGLATKVFNVWKNQFIIQYGLSNNVFASRIRLSSVELIQGPLYVWLHIDYVFVVDWVRSRQSVSIKLGTYPLAQDPSDSVILKAVNLEIRNTDQISLSGVISFRTALYTLWSCNQNMQPELCYIRFENVTGRLLLLGHYTIDYSANKCKEAAVDLSNGNLVYCIDEPCWID
jgi:hypothetical protein